MDNFKKLVKFIETRAGDFPLPEWAIFCEARELGIVDYLEDALMSSDNRHNFNFAKLASYYNNHSHI